MDSGSNHQLAISRYSEESHLDSPADGVREVPPDASIPLCVDLDGTLLRSDMLYESLLLLLKKNVLYVLLLPLWLAIGKAHLKQQIASRVDLDPKLLPYDLRVVSLLRANAHRPRVLCTAADRRVALAIASHLQMFDDVLASDGSTNLGGEEKASLLSHRFGTGAFDYVGNSVVDLPIWRNARKAWVVNGPPRLAKAASKVTTLAEHLPPTARPLTAWVGALRPHQWLKNLLVFVPLVAAHQWSDPAALLQAGIAFVSFGLCASGVYILNDLMDLPSDRAHTRKHTRPFARGDLHIAQGLTVAPLLVLFALLLSLYCGPAFAGVLLAYFSATLLYSLRLKAVPVLDVMVLAGLYTVRVIAGAVAIGVTVSFWLLAFSAFLFLSLAMLKRCVELRDLKERGRELAAGRGYAVEDLAMLRSLGSASGYLSVLVLALYIVSPDSVHLYSRPELLWSICPVLLYWMTRAWLMGHRGLMHDDPIVYAATDRTSYIVAALCGAAVLAAV